MRLIILGNGFDINLCLRTRYSDFMYEIEFHTLLAEGNSLAAHLKQIENERWVDIEKELLEYSRKTEVSFQNEYNRLVEQLHSYLKNIRIFHIMNRNSVAYKVLFDSLVKEIEFFTFNYTSSLEIILNEVKFNKPHLVNHVHGNLENTNLIFGVQDGVDLGVHSYLRKSRNDNYNSADLNDKLNQADEIIFFGHSLGESDHFYFEDFFQQQIKNDSNYKSIEFYYYNENAKDDILTQLEILTNNRIGKLKQRNDIKLTSVDSIEVPLYDQVLTYRDIDDLTN